jgi:hypothetical protein
MKNEIIKKSL